MKKVLVLFSGGIDSTLCLKIAIDKYGKDNVYALSINYGQNNDKELDASKNICDYYGISYKEIDITNIFAESGSSLIKASDKSIPYESYDEQYKKLKDNENVSTNVPYRNGVMLSICASYAISKNIDIIYYGIHTEEGIARALYPDCDEDFNMAINLAIYLGSGKKVKVEAPLSGLYKKDIIRLGIEKEIPFHLTWTCYENHELHCGKCTACTDRIKAFKENGFKDGVEYESMLR